MSYQFTNVSGKTQTQQLPGYNDPQWLPNETRSVPDSLLGLFRSATGVFAEGPLTTAQLAALETPVLRDLMEVRPGQIIMPATTSRAAGGWNLAGDVTLSALGETFNGRPVVRCSENSAGDVYGPLRAKIQVDRRGAAHGKLEFALRIPSGIGTGATIAIRMSSDEPANDPPTVGATNHMTWTFSKDQMRHGQWQVFSIDPTATADNSTRIGTAWASSGSPNYLRFKQIEVRLYLPSTGTQRYFDFTDIVQGGFSTPYILIGFDGAGTDEEHLDYALRRMDKWGLKGIFSIQGQVPTTLNLGYQNIIKRLHECGHEIGNEGLNHTNYGGATNSLLLESDVNSAIANFATLGITPQNSSVGSVYLAAQQTLEHMDSAYPGVATLRNMGFRAARYGAKFKPFNASAVGPDTPFGICPFTVGQAGSADVTTAADADKYFDAAELHGEMVMVLFHGIVASGAATIQTNKSVFDAIIDSIGARVYQQRAKNCTLLQYLDRVALATGYEV